jgi:hypothetical protein
MRRLTLAALAFLAASPAFAASPDAGPYRLTVLRDGELVSSSLVRVPETGRAIAESMSTHPYLARGVKELPATTETDEMTSGDMTTSWSREVPARSQGLVRDHVSFVAAQVSDGLNVSLDRDQLVGPTGESLQLSVNQTVHLQPGQSMRLTPVAPSGLMTRTAKRPEDVITLTRLATSDETGDETALVQAN